MVGGLLDGVRVLDLSRVLAGPFAAQVMADMGAEVIKVEFPGGDPARAIGPYRKGKSLYFSSLNSGKRGVLLNPATEPGRRALDALIGRADIVVENFRPAALAALELNPSRLLERHPRLIVVSISSFARSSERADEAAYDLTAQAEAGIMALTGEPGRAPVRAGIAVSDLTAALWAVLGAVSALFARERDGRGRYVEVPMLDATLPLLSYVATAALATGQEPAKVRSGHPSVCPYGAFASSDGWVVVAVLSDKFWEPLCRSLELHDLSARADLAHNDGRLSAQQEVESRIAQAMRVLSTEEALARLREADVPHGSVLSVLDALGSPYVRERGIVSRVRGDGKEYHLARSPLRSGAALRPAPDLGEHTEEVLREIFGRDSDLVTAIRQSSSES